MFKNYFLTAIRNMRKHKGLSFINITGLSVGMAVAVLIGLWIWNELSYDKYHKNYDTVAQVMQTQSFNGIDQTWAAIPIPLDKEMRKSYGSDFKHIAMSSWTEDHILSFGEKKISYPGNFLGDEGPEMFSLQMIKGDIHGLKGPTGILISQTVAKALFGDTDPLGKPVRIDNEASFIVKGIYEDLPFNTTLHEVAFLMPWDYYYNSEDKGTQNNWGDNSWQMFVQVADGRNMEQLSKKIKDVKLRVVDKETAKFKAAIQLHPMSKWHLYSDFENGVNTGGAIRYIWLFGIIGIFVLLLACINFMNLSTARSEKRAKEVGIRKAVGSLRWQLISQFYLESLLTAVFAFMVSLLLLALALPFFNSVANTVMVMPLNQPLFWILSIAFILFTALVAGSYPALYLSGFQPVKVLKGTFKAGRLAAIPRKVLVVTQFSVSICLIIGTIIVFNQIQYTKNRPIGYNKNGLINIGLVTGDLRTHFDEVKRDLLNVGAIENMTLCSSPTFGVNNNTSGLEWKEKIPGMTDDFANFRVTTEYGKTLGWQFVQGRDFSKDFLTDSLGLIINEAAVKYMNLKNPLGETVRLDDKNYHVIGVVNNIIMSSPYEPVKQAIYRVTNHGFGYLTMRINPQMNMHDALKKIETVCKTYSPSVPFSYRFADEDYAKKFADEERIGKLAGFFAGLAVFISCLGLFGMASFMAERRTKEIGVRKVLGATVFNLWRLLSKDFVFLVLISLMIAIPLSFYFMSNWLQHYQYRAPISWWVFAAAAFGALFITLATVSYQSIKAAIANPTKSLKTE